MDGNKDSIDINDFLVKEGSAVLLDDIPPAYKGELEKEVVKKKSEKLITKLQERQELLYADGGKGLLIVFQAMDAGGKDSTIRHVIGPLNPQGVRVTSFKAPTSEERSHDFLWRIHKQAPARGMIGVFNRSHYEEVLIVKVKKWASREAIEARYEHINNFERLLNDEGIRIVKFYLHISKEYQKERLQQRLDNREKNWKFNVDDLKERALWEDYREAFQTALSRCSTKEAPWYVIPAETRWFRDYLVAKIIKETIDSMDLKFPAVNFNPKSIVIE